MHAQFRSREYAALALSRLIPALPVLFAALLALRPAAAAEDAALHVLLNHAPPYRIIETRGGQKHFSGIYVDIARAMAERTGLRLVFVEVPYARAFAMMKNAEGDMMLGPNRTAEREQYLLYLEPALPAEPKAFVVRERGARIAAYDDLRGLRIATLRGAHYTARFDADAALSKEPVTDYETALRMLDGDRIDAAIMPEMRARWLLRGHVGSRLAELRLPGELSYIVLSRGSPATTQAARLSAALQALQRDGDITRILALYS